MTQTKTKRSSKKAGHSPMPHGPVCGHSGCGPGCNVRYAGPTSHPRDHQIHMAAKGMNHVWMAAIVAGLAVVLTGSIAYTAAQAETAPRVRNINEAVAAIYRKLDKIERTVNAMNKMMQEQYGEGEESAPTQQMNVQNGERPKEGQQNDQQPPKLSEEAKACVTACQTTWKSCQIAAGDSKESKEACTKTAYECVKACVPVGAPVPPILPPPTPQASSGGSQGAAQPTQ